MHLPRRLELGARVLFSTGLIVALFSLVGVEHVVSTLRLLSIRTVVAVLALYYGGMLISVFRWSAFLQAKGATVSTGRLYRSYLLGSFFNNFLPTSFGGDLTKLYSLRRAVRGDVLAASILLERATGLLVLVGLALISSAAMWQEPAFRATAIIGLSLSGAAALSLFSLRGFFSNRCADNHLKGPGSKLLGKLKTVLCEVVKTNVGFTGWLRVLALSVLFVFQGALASFLYFADLGANIALHQILVGLAVVQLVGLIPFTINGIGAREGAYVVMFGAFGVPAEISLSVALIGRVVRMGATLPGAVLLLLDRRLSASH